MDGRSNNTEAYIRETIRGAISNISTESYAETTRTVRLFRQPASFSGVYQLSSGNLLALPSGVTTLLLQTGKRPRNAVPRRGGHGRIRNMLRKIVKGGNNDFVGFTLFVVGGNRYECEFYSRGVNGLNKTFRGNTAPPRMQQLIVEALRPMLRNAHIVIRQRG